MNEPPDSLDGEMSRPHDDASDSPATGGRGLPAWQVRLAALVVFIVASAVLGVAAWLKPDPSGFGTHAQLPGQGECGMLTVTGYPCPTCGMTTAFAHTVRLQWLRAMWVQPGGFVLALATCVVAVASLWSLIRGRAPEPNWRWFTPFTFFAGMLVLLLGSWAFVLVRGLLTGTLPR